MASGGRWYPTTIALTDGDMFTAIGTATNQRYPDRWSPEDGWRIQTGIDFNDMVLTDYFSTGSHGESRWWPLLHIAPNGKVFHSGPTPQMHWINPARNGSFEPVGDTFTDFYHKHGTTVMYDEGKLLTAGGWIAGNNTTSTNQAFTVDLNGPTPIVQATSPMLYPRKFQNGVILPTGEVLVVGGNTSGRKFSDDGAVMVPEVWNPVTEQWRELAPMAIPRNYHSVALLLTDGTVLAAGSGYNSNSIPASTHQDGQVFSPPYLYAADGSLAPRPGISNGAGIVETGATFNVTTTESIDYFSMIKMSSTTHGLNTDVRFLRPQFAASGANSYDITLHANPNVATPGYWMLFAVNADGVPSEAHVLRITAVDTRYENIALSGAVSQSSDADGTSGAANAIDGDLSGHPGSNSLAATGSDAEAWWQIDLGQQYDLDTLRLWNRTDCCADELADFHVFISPAPFVSNSVAATQAQPGVTDIFHSGPATRQLDLSAGATGRYVRVQRTTPGPLYLAEVQAFGALAPEPPPPPTVIRAENGVLDDVGSDWQTVTLSQSFTNPVVIATPRYDGSRLPAVTRVRNAIGNSFDVRVQNPSDTPLAGYAVEYIVVEAGVYDNGDVRMEAQTFVSTVTDEDASWLAENRGYQQSYTNPVVVGQVMSQNDPDWSVFWASNGVTG
ncbi:MAG: galactose oxidase-like domain-containing protein, partial [Pseudomonadota bacterium]